MVKHEKLRYLQTHVVAAVQPHARPVAFCRIPGGCIYAVHRLRRIAVFISQRVACGAIHPPVEVEAHKVNAPLRRRRRQNDLARPCFVCHKRKTNTGVRKSRHVLLIYTLLGTRCRASCSCNRVQSSTFPWRGRSDMRSSEIMFC